MSSIEMRPFIFVCVGNYSDIYNGCECQGVSCVMTKCKLLAPGTSHVHSAQNSPKEGVREEQAI